MELAPLLQKLERGRWDIRLVLVYGEEPLGIEETAAALLAALEARGASRITCGPRDLGASLVEDAISQMSLFAEKRVLFVDGIPPRAEGLAEVVDRVLGSPDLFLLVRHFGDVDKRLRWHRKIQSEGAVFRFEPVKEREMPERIRERARHLGLELPIEGATALASRVGADLLTARNELEKLLLFASPRKRITLADIEAVVGRSRDTVLYEITEGISGRNRERSLADLRDLLRQGVSAGAILALLAREVRFLLQAKIALGEDRALGRAARSYPAFAAYLRDRFPEDRRARFGKGRGNLFLQHPYVAFLRLGQATKFDEAELAGLLAAFSRADRAVKTGAGTPETVLFATVAAASGGIH